jgi:hypothetical protein
MWLKVPVVLVSKDNTPKIILSLLVIVHIFVIYNIFNTHPYPMDCEFRIVRHWCYVAASQLIECKSYRGYSRLWC